MRQSSPNRGPVALPGGDDLPVTGALPNSGYVDSAVPASEFTLADLQRNLRESELLRQIAIKANEAATAGEAIQMCLDEVCAYTGWPVGHAYVPATDGTGELETTKLWHIDDPEQYENLRRVTEAIRYSYDQSLPSRVRAEAATQWMVSDATYQRMPRANARIEAGLKSGFAFPAMAGKDVLAVLEFFTPQAIEPDPQFLSVTTEIGILIGQAIERKQAEQALNDSETRYRQLAELSPDGMLVHVDGEIVFANASLARILAYPSPEDLLGKQAIDLLAPEYRASMEQRRDKVTKGETSAVAQTVFMRSDGSRVPVERTATQISWEGRPAIVVLYRDISERLEAERVVTESRDQLRLVTDNLPAWITYTDADLCYRFVNKTGSEWLARPVEEIVGKSVAELLGQEYEKIRSRVENTLAGEQLTYVDSITYPDGVTRTVRVTHVPHFGATGTVQGYFSLVEDISELQQAEQSLRESDERFRAIADNSPSAIFLKDTDGRYFFANRVWHKTYNPTGADIIGKTVHDFLPPEIADSMSEVEAKVLKTGVPFVGEQLVPTAGGRWQNMLSTKFPVRDGDGNIIALGIVNTDITERVVVEQALRDSEAHLAHAQRIAKLGSWVWELDTEKVTWSEALYQLMQIDPEAATDPVDAFYARVHPDDREQVAQIRERLKRSGQQQLMVYRFYLLNGEERFIHAQWVAEHDASGRPVRAIGITQDVTEAHQREEALRQAQKMEAVGQLTGGVAHDFNNLLAVILGNTELLLDEIGDHSRLASIDHAATRGAELTQRLLAFSRQQALAPQSIDLTELISSLQDLLHRTLGEPVKMLTHVSEEIWPVLVDPGQLENALLNLSINARDAMPNGGVLEIRCSNIKLQEGNLRVSNEMAAGDYVQIAVRDTGTGMLEGVLEHVFEPFYTTKGVGEGSGLGLSMVYGFARQSGGNVTIESEPGTGTEIKLFLPRSEVTTMTDELLQGKDRKRGQGEAILVLEDDPDVRSFAVAALEGLGYQVLEAVDAHAAMQVLEEEAGNVDLLLSDVVLPGGVSGPELAAKAKDLFPKLKLVFMSGYAADLYTNDKIPGFGETLLTKPFRLADLADAVHETLAA